MAVIRKKEIGKLDDKEMQKKLDELRLELSKERAKINIGASVTSPGRIKQIRRTIAKLMTIEREKSKSLEEEHKNG